MTSLRFAVIGAGRLGASFFRALTARGALPTGLLVRSPAGRERARAWTGMEPAADLEELVADQPDLYIISVPDEAVPRVARELADHLGRILRSRAVSGRTPVVLHTSGVTSVSALSPCARLGCTVLVFHPLQTFPDPLSGAERFQGAAVAITPPAGRERSLALTFGHGLADFLGARTFVLEDDRRTLYHAAAVLASNYFVALEEEARRLFVQAGLPAHEALSLFLPLVSATLDGIASKGTALALTGPISRGDVAAVERHLEALRAEAPDVLPLYVALGLATVGLAHDRQSLDETQTDLLRRTLIAYYPPAPMISADRSTRTGAP